MTETSTLVTTTTRSSQRPQPAPEGPRRPTRRRWPERRADESGLTTLEWLLIVAAVAGLAALAVVLVQNVVGETSEQIAGSSARQTAATIAADQIIRDANRSGADQPNSANTWEEWEKHYSSRCERLAITYGDAGITVQASFDFKEATSAGNLITDVVDADDITPAAANATDLATVAAPAPGDATVDALLAGKAIAHCLITSS